MPSNLPITWRRVRESDFPLVIIPVAAGNRRSWRALEKAGFQRVAEGALEPDNPIDPPLHYIQRIDRPRD
jgi:aminoglycoside 6'-N-acetyltransferase